MLHRGGPLPQADLERLVTFFQNLVTAPDILGFAEEHVDELTPAFLALVTLNLEQARSDGNVLLVEGLEARFKSSSSGWHETGKNRLSMCLWGGPTTRHRSRKFPAWA